jgi:hypothetical protein
MQTKVRVPQTGSALLPMFRRVVPANRVHTSHLPSLAPGLCGRLAAGWHAVHVISRSKISVSQMETQPCPEGMDELYSYIDPASQRDTYWRRHNPIPPAHQVF